ncbi:MAG: ABC transporter ATP-binding protein [Anaerolineae bacterium]|nr:ABC transporter ATP-binding protein [Anaerolineae bacterium]
MTSRSSQEPLLQVEDLSLRRDGRPILYKVYLTIRRGEIHGLLGLNGSGKSSLAYTLMGCTGYEPDSGHILFDGHDITRLSITERAKLGLTLAWQEPARFEGISVGKYLILGMPEPDRRRAAEALEAVDLSPARYLNRSINHSLSGGERKRIELAAVYAMQPKLAILDEPDSGVDTLSLSDIAALIRRMADQGTSILLITHRDEMVTVADSASLMCQGSIVFGGAPANVRRYYDHRCKVHNETVGVVMPEVIASGAEGSERRAT